MARGKRQTAEGGVQSNKRQKFDNANLTPKDDSVSQNKANTRSTSAKKDSVGEAHIMKRGPQRKKLQMRYIPPLTESHGFLCFPCHPDGDVLVILHPENTRHQLRLHTAILRNFSPVFCDLLSTKADENIPKNIKGPNPTTLEYCLELDENPKFGWSLQNGSLYEIPDDSKAIPATERRARRFGSDGTSEDVAMPSINEASPPQSPSQSPNVFSSPPGTSDELVPEQRLGSPPTQGHDICVYSDPGTSNSKELVQVEDSGHFQPQCEDNNGVAKAPHESSGSTLGDDNQAQGSTQQETVAPNPLRRLKVAAMEASGECPPTTEADIPNKGESPTPTYKSDTDMHGMENFTNPEQLRDATSVAKKDLPKEYVCGFIASPQTAELDNKTHSAPTSDLKSPPSAEIAENEQKTMGSSEMNVSANMPDIGATGQGVEGIPIPAPNYERFCSATKTEDKGKQTSLTGVNIESVPMDDDDCQIISVKSRSQSPLTTPVIPIAESRPTPVRRIEALYSLLRIAYYRNPTISKDNTKLALIQSEHLIAVANFYQVLPAVKPHISHLLAHHSRSLFQGILLEPIRWLNISIHLEDKIIFQEAVIHLVGASRGEFTSKAFPGVPRKAIDLVQRKHTEMIDKISKVNELLISPSGRELSIRAGLMEASLMNKATFNVWIIASLWREWLAAKFEEAKTQDCHTDVSSIQSKLGVLYRTISAGGDAYLPKDEFMATLISLQRRSDASQTEGFLQWDAAKYGLAQVKKYASSVVHKLCYNRSQLDPTESGFSYLTCIHIGNDEFPWVNARRN
ncbi:hypothetical protein V494_06011 [Pseudogymnoascus sp. VKM F-4513 (FW-928)]|nr:hypothetical protein V494_06011 [Pseudogymnoascus sp. VKM F-4513 (FW-928)]